MRPLRKTEWVLLALLPGVLYFAFTSGGEEEQMTPRADASAAALKGTSIPSSGIALNLSELRRRAASSEPADVFQSKSWYVPPPPPPAPPVVPMAIVVPPPPSAPPLPFNFLGLYQDSGKPVVFLVRGDRLLTVQPGEVIEGTYRVEEIVGSNLGLTYLPLNIKQILSIGNAG